MQTSLYFQAHVERSESWFVVAALKSFEHTCFDRTVDVENSIFEFFVAPDMREQFLTVMTYLAEQNLVSNLVELPVSMANLE